MQGGLSDYVHWCNNIRKHSAPGYLSPVEFRKRSLRISSH
ncbi:IS3 family transposase [Slackia isoflavoniconvertens]